MPQFLIYITLFTLIFNGLPNVNSAPQTQITFGDHEIKSRDNLEDLTSGVFKDYDECLNKCLESETEQLIPVEVNRNIFKCYPIFEQGPCPDGHWLVLSAKDDISIGVCDEEPPCNNTIEVFYNKTCFNTVFDIDSPCNDSGMDLKMNLFGKGMYITQCRNCRILLLPFFCKQCQCILKFHNFSNNSDFT